MTTLEMLFVCAWFLLAIGLYGLVIARHLLKVLIALQLMVKVAMLVLVVAGTLSGEMALGQSLAISVMIADTMAAVIGLALIVQLNTQAGTLDVHELIGKEV
jgi:NADH-quinone oxidoreductase subunit K